MTTMRLIKKIIYKGTIELLTGMHVGGTNTTLGIGGVDKSIVRNPITNLPYIPGSTIKGKMRSLLELRYGYTEDGDVTTDITNEVGQLFGAAPKSSKKDGRASRLIVRDAPLNVEATPKSIENADLYYAESKTEVSINRITAKSNPRTFERVPAGAFFDFEMVLNVFEGENETGMRETIKLGLQLIEADYLGGQGSRGYGQVKFHISEPTVVEYSKK